MFSFARLVHDLEELARAEAGQLRLDLEPIELEPILRAAVAAAGRAGAGAELSIDIEKSLPPARADAQRLRQMVDNLLTNARTHTPLHGKICLSAQCAGNEIEIAVVDTGPGLSEEEQGRVFERFYRGDPSRHRATGGAGLGLAIVAQLAAAQGGRAWVDSELGEGARFVFTVPRV